MLGGRESDSAPVRAASILREIFGGVGASFAFRLWDGTDVAVGDAPARFVVVVHTPRTFARLIRTPTPLTFAECFVDGAIDIDGDLFAAMDVANAIEDLEVPLRVRLRALGAVWAV